MVMCLSFILITFSCSSSDDKAEPELIVSKPALTFTKEGGDKTLHIKTNNSWNITSSETWCTVTPNEGNETGTIKMSVTAAPNTTTEDREALLTVKSGGITKEVKVSQELTNILNVDKSEFEIAAEGEVIELKLEYSTDYEITIDVDWIVEETQRSTSSATLSFSVLENRNIFEREGAITIKVAKLEQEISVNQFGVALTVDSDKSGMERDAAELAADMRVGWNLGNSLEACASSEEASETMWGNPKTTKSFIDAVKAAGFNTIRIPSAWSGYIEDQTNHKIKDSWLSRVGEVVDYCIDNDMYAILNIHWDGGWLENNPTKEKQEEVNKKQKALWEQIAVYFRDYDDHLLFAGTNEVNLPSQNPTAENFEVQLSYNQTFVDAVRSTGGRNSWRTLVVQGFNTNIALAIENLVMSEDLTPNRMMAEIHYYDPWDYCGLESDESWGTVKYFWGKEAGYGDYGTISDWGQEDWVREQFGLLKSHFVDKGYPVIMGEYGAIHRVYGDSETQKRVDESRNYHLNYVTKIALQNGIVPIYWDNGDTGEKGFGLFNRKTGEKAHPDSINAIVSAENNR